MKFKSDIYISERLYSQDPEFWKDSLALHCRRGLMFVCLFVEKKF